MSWGKDHSERIGKVRAFYSEALTAEIFAAIADIIPDNTTDKAFLEAQSKVRAIIAREYIEVEDRK